MSLKAMNLKVLLPHEILLNGYAVKVVAEAENGAFCLLPRHRDFVTALVPGILSFTSPEGTEHFVAVDEGVLVKSGPQVHVSTRHAVRDPNLETLRETVVAQFQQLDDKERQIRSAVAKLEADFVRRFLQFGETRHG